MVTATQPPVIASKRSTVTARPASASRNAPVNVTAPPTVALRGATIASVPVGAAVPPVDCAEAAAGAASAQAASSNVVRRRAGIRGSFSVAYEVS